MKYAGEFSGTHIIKIVAELTNKGVRFETEYSVIYCSLNIVIEGFMPSVVRRVDMDVQL